MTNTPAQAAVERAVDPGDAQYRTLRAHVRGTLIAAHQQIAPATGDHHRLPWTPTDDRILDIISEWLENLRTRA